MKFYKIQYKIHKHKSDFDKTKKMNVTKPKLKNPFKNCNKGKYNKSQNEIDKTQVKFTKPKMKYNKAQNNFDKIQNEQTKPRMTFDKTKNAIRQKQVKFLANWFFCRISISFG